MFPTRYRRVPVARARQTSGRIGRGFVLRYPVDTVLGAGVCEVTGFF
jgi:hypothetical protein